MPAESAWKLMHDHVMRSPLESMCCPITRELLVDPVMAQDGHTYEKPAILRHFQSSKRSPMTNKLLLNYSLHENHQCKMAVAEYKETILLAVSQMVPALLDCEELLMVEQLLDKATECKLDTSQLQRWRISFQEKSIASASMENVHELTPALCALANADMLSAGAAVAKLDTRILVRFQEQLPVGEPATNIVQAELLRRRLAEPNLILQLNRYEVGEALNLGLELLGMPMQTEEEEKAQPKPREEVVEEGKYFELFG